MVRISGVNIPNHLNINVALTYIFGIGNTTSAKVLSDASIAPDKKAKDLSESEVNKIKNIIEKNYKIEGDLRRIVSLNIKRLKEINTYRGSRHAKGLPVRGQRTKTNSRTVRGNVRRTAGSGRKPPAQKT